jgi:cyclase
MAIEEVAPGVFVETAYHLANVGCIVTGGGVVLVDAPFAPSQAKAWGEFVRSKGNLKYFVCTHAHPDHIGGHGFFSEAEMICHESIRDEFARYPDHLAEFMPKVGAEEEPDFAGFTMRKPSFTFTDRFTLRLGGRRIDFISADGHTASHTMVWVPDGHVLFSGDNVVNQWPPMCHQGVVGGWHDTLNRIYTKIHPHVIVPGHGPVCDASFALNIRDILTNVKREVQTAIAAGKSREEAMEEITYIEPFEVPGWFLEHARRMQKLSLGVIYDHVKG